MSGKFPEEDPDAIRAISPSEKGIALRRLNEIAELNRVYRLTPLDLSAPAWGASIYGGMAVIRARDAEGARKLAKQVFNVASLRQAAVDTLDDRSRYYGGRCPELALAKAGMDAGTVALTYWDRSTLVPVIPLERGLI